jgi:hypothetical protein
MGETALKLVETNEVETKALSIVDQAKAVKVIDSESYTAAGGLWKAIKDMMKEVSDTFDPIITAAHASHKKALEQKAKFYTPLEKAYKDVKKLMSDYDTAQEAIRQAEEARLREIARKAEEERLLMEAIAAEAVGEKEEAAAIINEPVYVPPVVVQKEVPKVQGMSFRTIWKFRIVDGTKIPRNYMIPDEVKIGQVVRALKKESNIPGIEVYEERV